MAVATIVALIYGVLHVKAVGETVTDFFVRAYVVQEHQAEVHVWASAATTTIVAATATATAVIVAVIVAAIVVAVVVVVVVVVVVSIVVVVVVVAVVAAIVVVLFGPSGAWCCRVRHPLLHEPGLLLKLLHHDLLLLHVGHRVRHLLIEVGVIGVDVVGGLPLSCVDTVHACGLSAEDLNGLFLDAALHEPPIERCRDGQSFVRG